MEVARRAPLSMGTLHTRILERVAGPSSRGSSQPKDQTQVSSIAGGFFTVWVTREAWNSNWILFDSQTLSLFTNLTTSETLGKAQHPCALVYLLPHERGIWFVLARWLLLNSRKSRKRRVEDSWEKGGADRTAKCCESQVSLFMALCPLTVILLCDESQLPLEVYAHCVL